MSRVRREKQAAVEESPITTEAANAAIQADVQRRVQAANDRFIAIQNEFNVTFVPRTTIVGNQIHTADIVIVPR